MNGIQVASMFRQLGLLFYGVALTRAIGEVVWHIELMFRNDDGFSKKWVSMAEFTDVAEAISCRNELLASLEITY